MKIIPYILAFSLIGCGAGDDGSNGANCYDHLGDANKDGVTDSKDCVPVIPEASEEEEGQQKAEEEATLKRKAAAVLASISPKQLWDDVSSEAKQFLLSEHFDVRFNEFNKDLRFYELHIDHSYYVSVTFRFENGAYTDDLEVQAVGINGVTRN